MELSMYNVMTLYSLKGFLYDYLIYYGEDDTALHQLQKVEQEILKREIGK